MDGNWVNVYDVIGISQLEQEEEPGIQGYMLRHAISVIRRYQAEHDGERESIGDERENE